jgi:hypothetical protein
MSKIFFYQLIQHVNGSVLISNSDTTKINLHQNFPIYGVVFGLTRSGLEPTIYHTRSVHTYHYTTDVVTLSYDSRNYTSKIRKKLTTRTLTKTSVKPYGPT